MKPKLQIAIGIALLLSPILLFSQPAMGRLEEWAAAHAERREAKEVLWHLTWMYGWTFRPNEAAQCCASYEARYPDDPAVPEVRFDRAVWLESAGRRGEAIAVFRSVATDFPDHPLAKVAEGNARRLELLR